MEVEENGNYYTYCKICDKYCDKFKDYNNHLMSATHAQTILLNYKKKIKITVSF